MKAFPATPLPLPARDRGVTLIVVLMILLVVTVLGIGAAKLSLLGERSARFDRDYQVAWQAAEAALMDAELDMFGGRRDIIFSGNIKDFPAAGCHAVARSQGLCKGFISNRPVWLLDDLSSDTGTTGRTVQFGTFTERTFDAGGIGVSPAKPPRYIIEAVADGSPGDSATIGKGGEGMETPTAFRVTAIGFGPREDIQAVVQLMYVQDKD